MEARLVINKSLTQLGNQKPHFTITADIFEGRTLVACGPMHEEILLEQPDLQDFVDMHLSDIDGVPMHAVENGWYWLSSSLGGLGEKYFHANVDEAFLYFCKHCRITTEEGDAIRKTIWDVAPRMDAKHTKAKWVEICESMKPRWKREAEALIRKYHLKVQQE